MYIGKKISWSTDHFWEGAEGWRDNQGGRPLGFHSSPGAPQGRCWQRGPGPALWEGAVGWRPAAECPQEGSLPAQLLRTAPPSAPSQAPQARARLQGSEDTPEVRLKSTLAHAL